MTTAFVILASEDDIRVNLFQQALRQQNLAEASIVSYLDFIQSPDALLQACGHQPCILRIDSPGRNKESHAAILKKGISTLKLSNEVFQTKEQIHKKLQNKGQIIAPNQFYYGFKNIMTEVEKILKVYTNITPMNHPTDIDLAFDKFKCQRTLQQCNFPIPKPLGLINNYEQLREEMKLQKMPRVFIKLKYGSAASGIIAFETTNNRMQIKTTIETSTNQHGELILYNTRRIQKSTDEKYIRKLIDTLCKMEVQVERWIPKAQVDGYNVDLRILMIAGKAKHKVLRMSRSPITNLHLLNHRDDVSLLKQKMATTAWDSLINSCEAVALKFSKSLYVAIDAVVSINLKEHYIIEVNAFGDLLKDVTHNNLNPQEAQIAHIKNDHKHFAF